MAEKIVVKAEKRDERARMRTVGCVPKARFRSLFTAVAPRAVAATAELKGSGGDSSNRYRCQHRIFARYRGRRRQRRYFPGSTDRSGQGPLDPCRSSSLRKGRKDRNDGADPPDSANLKGLKEEGAVLTQAMREIKVLCEPANTPDSIDVDVTDLTSDHAVHVSDLKIGAGIEIHESPETVVASIVIVKEVELEPQVEEGAEPEVVGEDKPDEEGEGEDKGGDKGGE